ncbi:MAG: histidine kinase [Pseudomonadota bacterium]|jgi:two-component system sensor histidine kinase AlgZ
MASINQNGAYPITLPNFRNLGIDLRILLLVDGMSVAAALLKTSGYAAMWRELMEISAVVQPVLLLSLLTLYLLYRPLYRLPYRLGVVAVVAVELLLTALVYAFDRHVSGDGGDALLLARYWLFTLAATGVLLAYFHLRSRALSPALGEARLQALQARIRPHFLFNSINAVLSLIRSDPKRAERALEDMADLFRVLMADNRQLVNIGQEVGLCRQYLELEQLRLGERLKVAWHIEKMPPDALIPPLVLQPLAENAVYHGIEPSSDPGEVSVNIYRRRNHVHLVLRNPYRQEGRHHGGNKMALSNIRERLALHFDAEARLDTKVSGACYLVHIIIPYVTSEPCPIPSAS